MSRFNLTRPLFADTKHSESGQHTFPRTSNLSQESIQIHKVLTEFLAGLTKSAAEDVRRQMQVRNAHTNTQILLLFCAKHGVHDSPPAHMHRLVKSRNVTGGRNVHSRSCPFSFAGV